MSLHHAVSTLDNERARAELRGDHAAVDRLSVLLHLVEIEAQYATHVAAGLPIVRRRTDAPAGATVAWWWAHDPAVRATRRLLGLPMLPIGDTKELLPRGNEEGWAA